MNRTATKLPLSCGLLSQFLEVLDRLGHGGTEQPNLDPSGLLSANFNVEIHLRGGNKNNSQVAERHSRSNWLWRDNSVGNGQLGLIPLN